MHCVCVSRCVARRNLVPGAGNLELSSDHVVPSQMYTAYSGAYSQVPTIYGFILANALLGAFLT
jgi:hypothetical protein